MEISAVVKMDEQERRGQFREHVPGGSIFVSRGGSILASVEGRSPFPGFLPLGDAKP